MKQNDYPEVNLSAWSKVGEGGNGTTYENPAYPDMLLKLNNAHSNQLEPVKQEFDRSVAVSRLGLPTPAMYQIVRVGDAYASLSERIRDKKSLSRICHDEPQRTEEMACLLARLGRQLADTPCDTSYFPNRKEQALQAVDSARILNKKTRAKICAYIETLPDSTGCSHGDFQPGNVILSGGQCYWIDLGRFAYGAPLFDIGHLYMVCQVYAPMKQVQDIFHMSLEQFHRFWDAFATEYTGSEDHARFDRLAGKHAAIDVLLRPIFQKPSFLEKIFLDIYAIKLVRQYFAD